MEEEKWIKGSHVHNYFLSHKISLNCDILCRGNNLYLLP